MVVYEAIFFNFLTKFSSVIMQLKKIFNISVSSERIFRSDE
jgi:hypothetical protein